MGTGPATVSYTVPVPLLQAGAGVARFFRKMHGRPVPCRSVAASAKTSARGGNYIPKCPRRRLLAARGRSLFAEPRCSGNLAMSD